MPMTTRVLVADALASEAFDDLRHAGVEVDVRPDLGAAALAGALAGYKVLVVRSTEVTEAALEAADCLALVVRAGSGTNNIDVAAASARGIFVSSCPGKNSVAVAELAFGLMLVLDRRIADNVIALREGRWDKKGFSKARGLKGQRLGLVGFGNIAREVADRAHAFGMPVLAYAPSLTEEQAERAGVARATSLEQVFRRSDIVSLHLPLSARTRGLIGAELLAALPTGAMLINTSRAEVVDAEALLREARSGRIRVGTDVFAAEPEAKSGTIEDPLAGLPNVVGTHHIGASTDQAQAEIAAETVRIVEAMCLRGAVLNPVNLLLDPETAGTVVVRHRDKVGVLAAVLSALRGADINVETMENIVFAGGQAACARIKVSRWPEKETLRQIAAHEHILHVEVV